MTVSNADRVSLSHAETFQDIAKPHAIFTQLRREEPVAWCPEPWGGPGFWSITKYDDIHAISKLPQVFSSDARLGGITLPSIEDDRESTGHDARAADGARQSSFSQFEGGRSMIMMDPPEHVQHRRMVAPGFTPQRLDALIPRIRERARVDPRCDRRSQRVRVHLERRGGIAGADARRTLRRAAGRSPQAVPVVEHHHRRRRSRTSRCRANTSTRRSWISRCTRWGCTRRARKIRAMT